MYQGNAIDMLDMLHEGIEDSLGKAAINLAVDEILNYHKRLKGLMDDPNCRANRAKAKELLEKNS